MLWYKGHKMFFLGFWIQLDQGQSPACKRNPWRCQFPSTRQPTLSLGETSAGQWRKHVSVWMVSRLWFPEHTWSPHIPCFSKPSVQSGQDHRHSDKQWLWLTQVELPSPQIFLLCSVQTCRSLKRCILLPYHIINKYWSGGHRANGSIVSANVNSNKDEKVFDRLDFRRKATWWSTRGIFRGWEGEMWTASAGSLQNKWVLQLRGLIIKGPI